MHSMVRRSTSLVVLVVAVLVLASGTSGGLTGRLEERLPAPVAMTCAVSTGTVVYVFGGATEGAILDTIWAIDPESGRTTVVPHTLPSPRKLASAVWTGSEAYIIGGIGYDGEPIAEIVRFVPGEGVSVVDGAMPYGTKGIPSVWSGEAVYILGNCLSSQIGHNDVIRFDPASGTSEIIEDVLPIPGAGSSTTWADGCAYIVGGRQNLTVLSDRIIRYVPGEGAEYVDAKLPQGRIGAACAWDGERVYAFGGTIALECGALECVPIDYLDQIVVFDPVDDTCTLSTSPLREPMDVRAAVFVQREGGHGDGMMVPGGLTSKGPTDRITVHYVDPPDVPEPERTVLGTISDWVGDNTGTILVIVVVVAAAIGMALFLSFRREGEDGPSVE